MDKKFADAKGWNEDMKSIEAASKVELPALRQTMGSIKNGLSSVNTLLSALASTPAVDYNDKFHSIVSEWAKVNQKKYEQLDQACKDAETLFIKSCEMFGEDGKVLTPNEFFGRLNLFITAYNTAKMDNDQAILKQAELEKKEREKAERTKAAENKKAKALALANEASSPDTPSPTSPAAAGDTTRPGTATGGGKKAENNKPKDGELDDLISSIKTGQAFFNQDFNPKQQRKKEKTTTQVKKDTMQAIADIITGEKEDELAVGSGGGFGGDVSSRKNSKPPLPQI